MIDGGSLVLDNGVLTTADAKSRTWSLHISSGVIIVNSCMNPRQADASANYNDDDDTSWAGGSSICNKNALVQTSISALEFLEKGDVNSEPDNEHIVVRTTTFNISNPKRKLVKKARLALPDPTKVCVVDDGTEVCNVDHCKFMMPATTANGSVMYSESGKPHLVPNPFFYEPIPFTVDPTVHSVKKGPDDPDATELIAWLEDAYEFGKKNPFDEKQGIQGYVNKESLVTKNAKGQVMISLPGGPPTGKGTTVPAGTKSVPPKSTKANIKFKGFLFKYPNTGTAGSISKPWPVGTTYADNGNILAEGCKRTVGTGTTKDVPGVPNFCARVDFTYETDRYIYPNSRTCKFYGPTRLAGLAGSRSWIRRKSLRKIGPWADVSNTTVLGKRTISDSRSIYKDRYPHHIISQDGEIHTPEKHNFRDVKVGLLKQEQVRRTPGNPDQIQRRVIVNTFRVNCKEEREGARVTEHDQSACYYLAYENMNDRFQCSRSVSARQCRNSNGCFAKGTKITMANQKTKTIEMIRPGMFVWNPATRTQAEVMRVIVGDQKKTMFKITYGSNEVKATYNHPFVTKTGIKTAMELKTGDEVMDSEMNPVTISKITELPVLEGTLVWNLLLKGNGSKTDSVFSQHMFLANGIVAGDYHVQQLKGQNFTNEASEFTKFLISRDLKETQAH